jgi:hypothetical protein
VSTAEPGARPDGVDDPWPGALDDFERQLAEFRAVLEHDTEPPAASWLPPEVSGHRLSPALVPRARRLLAEANELESQLRARQASLRRANLGPHHRSFVGRPSHSTEL